MDIINKKLAIMTLAVGDDYYRRHQIPISNTQDYCNKHGYEYIVIRETVGGRHPAHFKLTSMVDALNSGEYEAIMWLDTDTLIMDHSIKLEHWLSKSERPMIIAPDIYHVVNSGVWIVRNDEFIKSKLLECFDYPERYKWWEQPAVNDILLPTGKVEIIRELSGIHFINRLHGANRYYRNGVHWILHFASKTRAYPDNYERLYEYYSKYIKR